MADIITISLLALLGGLAMPLGAWIARIERITPLWLENEFSHFIIAFGGGALLSAVALVLVPHGLPNLNLYYIIACFGCGGVAFMAIDYVLFKVKTSASQMVAMLMDFIPESLALGTMYVISSKQAFLLALLISLQNLPEGFNAYRELLNTSKLSSKRIIYIFLLMALVGPALAITGYWLLVNSPQILSGVMLFASGGILYSVFQDIAPQAKLKNHWLPPMGAVSGFLFGIVGNILIVG